MSEVFDVDPERPDTWAAAFKAASRALRRGQLVILPTETVYGVAARPEDGSATARLFSAKRRPRRLGLPVLSATAGAAWELGVPDDRAERLAAAFWPGPLTLVVPRTSRSRGWELGEGRESIALRVPDMAVTSALLEAAGSLAVTSANLSGRPPLDDRAEVIAAFGDSVAVYIVLPRGVAPPGGSASTVVDLTTGGVRVLRAGPVPAEEIEAVARRG